MNGIVAKESAREVRKLNKRLLREQYLRKKEARSVQANDEHAERTVKLCNKRLEEREQHVQHLDQQIADLKSTVKLLRMDLKSEKQKTKSDALFEHREDIRRLQQAQNDKKESVQRWNERYEHANQYPFTLFLDPFTTLIHAYHACIHLSIQARED